MERKKHQRQSISLETKFVILDRLGKGEGSAAIGKHFNLGESTVRAIKKNEAAIRKSVISGIRDVLLERTERAIAIWIEEQVQRRIPVSGYLIQEKALQFYKSMKQESATADEGAVKKFPEELAKIIEDGDYTVDQEFKADETGLYWKKLPNRTYIAKDEKTASGHKTTTEKLKKQSVINLQPIFRSTNTNHAKAMLSATIAVFFTVAPTGRNPYMGRARFELRIGVTINEETTPENNKQKKFHDDIDELLVDDALSDNDIIDLTLDLTVDGVVGLEGDNDEEEKSTPLTGKLIQEGLQLCSKLENNFLINDPNSERASKLQSELQNCMSGYRELYKRTKESSSQSLFTDYIVRKGRATQNENEVCENPWPLPQISIAEAVSSDDEGDLEQLRKRFNHYQIAILIKNVKLCVLLFHKIK
ncbi:tigger transposable element-derived protein 1 [Trichonephila clavipes]|nr:tigger transposable element-derived protein 1 [Trichonephila clavipes]